ncbi:MAG TPA: cytochrome c oxidase assembly factor Coa1 family protein [Blastocatellia bacterium]|nr:cytochrome c oxidase assembly factor Coa1 family protein [Blastocatellia bacterium]
MQQPPVEKTGWLSRNWKWVLPVGCFGLLAIGVAVVMLFLSLVFGKIKSSDVYQQAVAKASVDSAVVREIGQPIETGWLVGGTINWNGARGNADLAIPISGPKGKGTIYAVATKSAGQWTFTSLEVETEGSSTRINLLQASP